MTHRREPRAVVDGWLLEEFLGRGGNAEVWLASRGDTEHVALKILNQSNPRSEPYRRFRDEVSVLQRIGDHHGVLPLIDALIPDRPTNSRPAWLAMPRAEPLKERLGEEGDIRQIVSAIQSIAGTLTDLERAHAVYHRDLKPQNLFWYSESWRVGDFGLVDYPDKQALTRPGHWVGAVHYLAPEVLLWPDTAKPGPADVYALAKTLWVLITRQNFPLPGHLARTSEARRVSSYFAGARLSPLENLLDRSTSDDPAERPNMETFAAELSAWLETGDPQPATVDVERLREIIEPRLRPHLERVKSFEDLLIHGDDPVERFREQNVGSSREAG